jgi:hypothetical protein
MDLRIHSDYFTLPYSIEWRKNNCFCGRTRFYIMRGADVVKLCYTFEEAKAFVKHNKSKDNVPVLGTFSQKLWDKRPENWYNRPDILYYLNTGLHA